MIFYIVFFLIICITSIQYSFRFVKNDFSKSHLSLKYKTWLLTLALMTLILGFRYQVGTDYMSYVHIFELYKSGAKTVGVEMGYELLNKIVLLFDLNFWVVFFISSAITNYFILKLFHEKSYNFFLSIYILFGVGFVFFQTNAIRQALAISLTFYGTKYLTEQNFKKYFVFCLLGSLFHFSALIMIPIYWLSRIKFNKLIIMLNIEKDVIFLGFKDNPYKYINKSKIFAFTSLREGFPMVLLESLASGTPVISTDCKTGPREILAPETKNEVSAIKFSKYGVLTPPFNYDKFNFNQTVLTKKEKDYANTLINLMKNKELINKYKENQKERIKEFIPKNIIKEWKKIIDE